VTDSRTMILKHLLHRKEGLTIEELSGLLGISRSGVQQHLSTLQRDRLVHERSRRNPGTGGRPSLVFALTETGLEFFPRQYALLSEMLLRDLKVRHGTQLLSEAFARIAEQLSREYAPALDDADARERIAKTVSIMNDLGYEATLSDDGVKIQAVNCIFHHLAKNVREVCDFDVALLEQLTDGSIEHVRCMADGEHSCVFKVTPRSTA